MGRLVAKRFTISGKLKAVTPVHVGGVGDDLVVDMPLAVDGRGCYYIPGTSLTGPIRAWWARAFGAEEASDLFGRTARSETDEGHASHVRIADAPVAAAAASGTKDDMTAAITEIRDGVGIDRVAGTAADQIKYDRAVIAKEACFIFCMEIDVPATIGTDDLRDGRRLAARQLNDVATLLSNPRPKFGALITALEAGQIRFGAAKTRGLGRLLLTEALVAEISLEDKAGIVDWLRRKANGAEAPIDDELCKAWQCAAVPVRRNVIDITITWRPVLPVMSKSGVDGLLVDTLPFVTAVGNSMVPIIAGSSIKGALRRHGERIWRTLAETDAPDAATAPENAAAAGNSGTRPQTGPAAATEPSDTGKDGAGVDATAKATDLRKSKRDLFLKQLEEAELPNLLFGAAATGRDASRAQRAERVRTGAADRAVLPGLGAVSVEDCEIGKSITLEKWEDLVTPTAKRDREPRTERRDLTEAVKDAERLKHVRKILDGSLWQDTALPITHAAIDRWTGGAADKALFTALELREDGPHFITMSVDLDRIACAADRDDPLTKPAEPKENGSADAIQDYRRALALYDQKRTERLAERERLQHAALALLVFTLQDFAAGRVPLGFGTNRGLGSVDVDDIVLTGEWPASTGSADPVSLIEGDPAARETFFKAIDPAWQAYWADFRKRTGHKDKAT